MTMKRDKGRRAFLKRAALGAGTAALAAGCRRECPEVPAGSAAAGGAPRAARPDEEYVWISAHANLPLFVAHDHPALEKVGKELGVKVTIAGPNTLDIPALVAAIEQVAARRPAGMMVVGWEPSALVPPIDAAVAAGIPVVCVDGDVPASRRLAFIGTDWYDLGVRQGEAMARALAARGKPRGARVALLGLIEQEIDQKAFAGFRSVVEKAGYACLEPLQDKGTIAEAARVAAGVLQAQPDLAGMAGFDSESGPGMGQAIKEAGKAGQIVATCVEAEAQHLQFVKEGVLTALVGQKRELFTYYGVRVLHDIVHSNLRFTNDDRKAGVVPVPVALHTGTYTVTRDNVDAFLKA
jgi:ABC-type sugar transport system substrate-binding protein